MKTLTIDIMATLIPPWASTAPPYTYDATPTRCYPCTYDALYDYDDTRRANSSTFSTTVTTTFNGDPGFVDNGGLFEDAFGGHEQDTAGIGMSLYGYRHYKPDLGRWVNRDPLGDHAFLRQHSKGKHRKVKKRLRAQSKAPAYLFVFNNPLTYMDAQGLLSFHSNCDDPSALLASDKTTLSQKMADAKAKLQDYEDGNITLGSNLTDSMATCIKGKLDSVTLSCMPCWNPICWAEDGFSAPNTGQIGVCVYKIMTQPGGLTGVELLIYHEIVHECGKIGHSTPDAPDDWAAWIWGPTVSAP